MGVRFGRLHHPFVPSRPSVSAVIWLCSYSILWALICWIDPAEGNTPAPVRSLIAWGALYFAGAIYFAQSTTEDLVAVIKEHVVPNADRLYRLQTAARLRRDYPFWLLFGVPFIIAALAVPVAWWALATDLAADEQSLRFNWEVGLWCVSYFLYFWCAAVAVIAARFYWTLASNLHLERARFYVLGAADTPLVKGLSRLGSRVLVFWVLIFLSILSSMSLALLPEPWALPQSSYLLFLMVPICGFFSLGFGTMVYLQTEGAIRSTLQAFTNSAAGALQKMCNAILDPGEGRIPRDTERLDLLTSWHDRIVAGGRYGSRLGTSVSISLPLLLPVVSLLVQII
ncbi:MAG TPA: hypothetical protein VF693_06380 [Allosphingosinicella sp.]|jgi:hypothetical protein